MLAAASASGIPVGAGGRSVVALPGMNGDLGGMAQQQQAQLQQQQQQQQQFNALMAPAASSSAVATAAAQAAAQLQPPQAQAPSNREGGEEKSNYDLSDFYEEV